MHACEALLDKAYSLALAEAEALGTEDAEHAAELSEARAVLLSEAWEKREGFDQKLLKARLEAMATLQDELILKASALHASLQSKIGVTKKQAGYFKDSKKRQAESQKAFYLSKRS